MRGGSGNQTQIRDAALIATIGAAVPSSIRATRADRSCTGTVGLNMLSSLKKPFQTLTS